MLWSSVWSGVRRRLNDVTPASCWCDLLFQISAETTGINKNYYTNCILWFFFFTFQIRTMLSSVLKKKETHLSTAFCLVWNVLFSKLFLTTDIVKLFVVNQRFCLLVPPLFVWSKQSKHVLKSCKLLVKTSIRLSSCSNNKW